MLVRFLRSRPRYRIRRGRPADAEGLYAVQERAVRVLGRQVYNDSQIESWVHGNSPQRYVEAMRGDGERFEVAVSGLPGAIGFCAVKGQELCSLYVDPDWSGLGVGSALLRRAAAIRSEEHTSELQSLMRLSYAVFCSKKKHTFK